MYFISLYLSQPLTRPMVNLDMLYAFFGTLKVMIIVIIIFKVLSKLIEGLAIVVARLRMR